MIVLDTTVLVYAVGADHQYRDPCRQIIEAVRDGRLQATTTVEVVQEFTHVRARRRGRHDAATLALDVTDLLTPLLSVNEHHLRAGMTIYQRSDRLGSFDSVLAAAAIEAGATAFVSADKAFGDVAGLRHVVPGPGVIEVLVEG